MTAAGIRSCRRRRLSDRAPRLPDDPPGLPGSPAVASSLAGDPLGRERVAAVRKHVHTWNNYPAVADVFQVICRDCGRIETSDYLVMQQHALNEARALCAEAAEMLRALTTCPSAWMAVPPDCEDLVKRLEAAK